MSPTASSSADITPNPNATTPQPPAGSPPAGASLTDIIPESYRESEWAKQNAKDPDTFFKWVDNLNTTVGKKGVIIPGEGAAPEEIANFHKTLGVPDKPEEYEFGNIEELKDAKRDDSKDLIVKQLFKDAGIPKAAAAKVQQGFEKFIFSEHQKAQAENQKLNEEFNNQATKVFGDKKDVVIAGVKKILAENTTPEIRAKVEGLDNESLIILASAVDGIAKKYMGEDAYKGGTGHVPGGAETFEMLSAKQRELMKHEGFTNFRHPDHQRLMLENNEIMKKMREVKK